MSGYLIILITLATAILPFVVGTYLARYLKMPDYGWKIGVLLLCVVASLVVIWSKGGRPKLGVDLSGGVIMVYEVLPSQDPQAGPVDMDKLIGAVARRVNPGGVKEVSVRRFGEKAVEIIIPEADSEELDRIERKISRAGTLEFRILANSTDHDDLIRLAEESTARQVRRGDSVVALWVPLDEGQDQQSILGDTNLATRRSPDGKSEVLVVIDKQNVNGGYLRSAIADNDAQTGRPSVGFLFDARGADLFYRLTSENSPDAVSGFKRRLAIILDGTIYSAPTIDSPIAERGQISGSFTPEEQEDLVAVLQAGSLPATLTEEPISSQVIGPTLGQDTIDRGAKAMLLSLIVVPIVVLIYYRFAGFVANLALFLAMLLIVATMMVFNVALTLPGLAGLVLTIGMAIDANVLIYERMREELERGSALRMAIRNGFDRATVTITDSNVTTIITGIVLYAVGTEQVKGFAATLILGIIWSMFTAVFGCRVVFDIAERRRWITNLKMMQIIGETHIDFLGKRRGAVGISLAMIAIGMVAVFFRGSDILNIDFTGGSKVEVLFNEPQKVAEIRSLVSEEMPDVTVNDVQITGEPAGVRFQVVTSLPIKEEVQNKLQEMFGDKLAQNGLKYELATITSEMLGPAAPALTPGTTSPAETSTPPAEAPAGGTTIEAPAGEVPTGPPSESAPADESATPASNEGAARASLDGELLAFAFQESDAEAPAETAPATPATEQSPAESTPPVEENPAATAPTTEPAPATTTVPAAATEAPAVASFVGGTQARLEFQQPLDRETVEDMLHREIDSRGAEHSGTRFAVENLDPNSARSKLWQVRFDQPQDKARVLLNEIQQRLNSTPVFPSAEQIGGAVAGNTRVQALYAMVASLLATLVYIWVRFQKVSFGAAAIVATVHDVLITLGILAISKYVANSLGFLLIDPFKIDLSIVAAFLTLVGYSLNDTIVIFDRIREVRGKSPVITIDMLNQSVNQTLSRTLLTGSTTLMVILILYIGGGEGIHGFAFTLLIGILTGTFSSIYVAAPVLYWLLGRQADAKPALATKKARAAV
ncbi:MAG: protein translocase subunit SecD [Pirellulales bacterium]|nr:protein translocase subunit SecD [Pirellulales bacterium]